MCGYSPGIHNSHLATACKTIPFANICEALVDGLSVKRPGTSHRNEIFVSLALVVLNYKLLNIEDIYCKTDCLNKLAFTALKQSIGFLGLCSNFRLNMARTSNVPSHYDYFFLVLNG